MVLVVLRNDDGLSEQNGPSRGLLFQAFCPAYLSAVRHAVVHQS